MSISTVKQCAEKLIQLDSTVAGLKNELIEALTTLMETKLESLLETKIEKLFQDKFKSLETSFGNAFKNIEDGVNVSIEFVKEECKENILKCKEEIKTEFEQQLSARDKLIKEQSVEIQKLHISLDRVNDLEQYTRRDSIRIFGIPETPHEDLAHKIKVHVIDHLPVEARFQVNERDIVRYHRVGRNTGDRSIIVKFVSWSQKMRVVRARRVFKGKNVSISDDLTAINAQRLKIVKNMSAVENTWSWDGKLYAKLKTESKPRLFHHPDQLTVV